MKIKKLSSLCFLSLFLLTFVGCEKYEIQTSPADSKYYVLNVGSRSGGDTLGGLSVKRDSGIYELSNEKVSISGTVKMTITDSAGNSGKIEDTINQTITTDDNGDFTFKWFTKVQANQIVVAASIDLNLGVVILGNKYVKNLSFGGDDIWTSIAGVSQAIFIYGIDEILHEEREFNSYYNYPGYQRGGPFGQKEGGTEAAKDYVVIKRSFDFDEKIILQ